tara:strand:- start:20141 stop:20335 length:195 start_codon:yes stop_codon:yes gene_type:complete
MSDSKYKYNEQIEIDDFSPCTTLVRGGGGKKGGKNKTKKELGNGNQVYSSKHIRLTIQNLHGNH